MSSSTFLTASWLASFVPADSSRTILLIDRSEPRFECHTGGTIRITLKNNKHFDLFCLFLAKSDLKFFWPDHKGI